jgi:hypothetical protein
MDPGGYAPPTAGREHAMEIGGIGAVVGGVGSGRHG